MLIRIWVDEALPFQGWAELDGTEQVPFAGWLELLSILSNYVAPHEPIPRS